MASKQKKAAIPRKPDTEPPAAKAAAGETNLAALPWWSSFKIQAVIIALLGFIFYANTFQNGFALDDRPIIVENEYVLQGVAGIPKILTSDAFASFLLQRNSGKSLTGGRYRPLSIVTFAIEQQFLGLPSPDLNILNATTGTALSAEALDKLNHDMHYRHIVNVLLYIISVIAVLYFLRNIVFTGNAIIPFAAAILFVIHPVHTEVVANVKSRDEIMSLLFICLTFIFAFRYYDRRKIIDLLVALLMYLLALLSKEYALALVGLLPLSFYLFRKEPIGKSIWLFLPYLLPLAVYMLMRMTAEAGLDQSIREDIVSNPYLLATPVQKAASIIAVLLYYLRLLVAPYSLTSDYSYAQLPYNNPSDPVVWLSVLAYAGMIAAFIILFRKRHVLAFALAFYLANLVLVSNILIGLGATMGERLIYHSSLGFSMIVAWLLYKLADSIKPVRTGYVVMAGCLAVICILSGYVTIARNGDWKNDQTLFLKDVQTSPNSLLILSNAGSACIDMGNAAKDTMQKREWYNKGVGYLDRAIVVSHSYSRAWLNLGACHFYLGRQEQAFSDWDSLRKFNPGDPILPELQRIKANYYSKQGLTYGMANQHQAAIASFSKALQATPMDPDVWFNLGVAYFSLGLNTDAQKALERSLQIRPGNQRVLEFYRKVTAGGVH